MSTKFRMKLLIDLCMTIALPLLMAYNLIGEAAHEWIGAGMFVLVIIHNILNLQWYKNLFKGKYSPFRVFQLILDIAIVLSMVGLMVSGIMMSRHVFDFLQIRNGNAFARLLHMLSAYWGFVLMMVHLGFHTSMIMGVIKKAAKTTKASKARVIILRTAAIMLCGYGVYAFIHRQIGTYMFLQNQYVFFDFMEPLIFFFVDYFAIMALFVCVGHYVSGAIRLIPKKSRHLRESLCFRNTL